MKLAAGIYNYLEKGFLDCNTYVIEDKLTLLIDPGRESFARKKIAEIQKDGIKRVDLILLTHLHPDHYGAALTYAKSFGAKITLHPQQQRFFGTLFGKISKIFGTAMGAIGAEAKSFKHEVLLGEALNTGNARVNVMHTPGHSPESLSFYSPERKWLACGDLVFEQSTGRIDLPGGSGTELKNSIEEVSKLDVEYLLPGHMYPIIGKENIMKNYDFIKKYYFEFFE